MFRTIEMYLKVPFVQYALIVGVLIALCSSLLGVTLVLKRFSFIGDGLSHVAFGAMAVAGVLQPLLKDVVKELAKGPTILNEGIHGAITGVVTFLSANSMPFVLLATTLSAILLLRGGKRTRIKGDAAIAMISVGALALGYMLLSLFSASTNLSGDVCSTLFGSTSILTLTQAEVWLCVSLSAVVAVIFFLFYNKIFAVTFDEDFARASGTGVDAYNLLIAVVIAVIIVLAMNLVGSLLISALIIFPAMSAMRVFRSFRGVTVCSAVFSVTCALLGILVSIVFSTPVGSTIVAVDIVGFLIFSVIGRIRGGIAK
ncbi:MAG: metal ABC transporter permease [Clostridia bacterium]|nr:metal ABC transporter permease [Clostridia bacterium]